MGMAWEKTLVWTWTGALKLSLLLYVPATAWLNLKYILAPTVVKGRLFKVFLPLFWGGVDLLRNIGLSLPQLDAKYRAAFINTVQTLWLFKLGGDWGCCISVFFFCSDSEYERILSSPTTFFPVVDNEEICVESELEFVVSLCIGFRIFLFTSHQSKKKKKKKLWIWKKCKSFVHMHKRSYFKGLLKLVFSYKFWNYKVTMVLAKSVTIFWTSAVFYHILVVVLRVSVEV